MSGRRDYRRFAASGKLTAYVPTFTGLGTVTNASAFWKQVEDELYVIASCTTGTVSAALVSITLPSGLVLDDKKLTIINNTSNPGTLVGTYQQNAGAGSGVIITAPTTSLLLVYASATAAAASTPLVPMLGNAGFLGSTTVTAFRFQVPIAGWK